MAFVFVQQFLSDALKATLHEECIHKHENEDNEEMCDNALFKREGERQRKKIDCPLKIIYGILLLFVRDTSTYCRCCVYVEDQKIVIAL